MLRMFLCTRNKIGRKKFIKKVTKSCVSVFFTLTLQQVISINQKSNWYKFAGQAAIVF